MSIVRPHERREQARRESIVRAEIEEAIWGAVDLPWTEKQIRDEFDYAIQNAKDEGELK